MKDNDTEALNAFTDILTTNEATVPFNSIGNYHYTKQGSLWKFFSPNQLTDEDLD
jgi:hypothetical protein